MKRSNLFKRSAAMLLAGLMAVSMSACGGSSASGNDSGDFPGKQQRRHP